MSKTKFINPIVLDVLGRFEQITEVAEDFIGNSENAGHGLIVSGDAGLGKTYAVKKAIANLEAEGRVKYIKGGSITPNAIFCALHEAREEGQVIVLDDIDIANRAKGDLLTILDIFKGATEDTFGRREVNWLRATITQIMRDKNIPPTFDFQGSIIWITNEHIQTLERKTGSHWNAIASRFQSCPVWLNEDEKLLYTLHLIQEEDMLGENCLSKEGGYSEEVINDVVEYIYENYKYMRDVSPRVAGAIANQRNLNPDKWKQRVYNSFIRG